MIYESFLRTHWELWRLQCNATGYQYAKICDAWKNCCEFIRQIILQKHEGDHLSILFPWFVILSMSAISRYFHPVSRFQLFVYWCSCTLQRERERERDWERARERECVCVCVCERERERERERENWVNFQGHARCEGGRSNNCIDMKEPILWGIPNLQTRMSAKAKVELDTVQHEEPLVRRRVVSPEQVQLAFRICDCSVVNMVLSVIWHQNPTDISSRCCTTSEEVQCQNQTCVCVCVCVCVCEHCFPKALGECWPAYMSVVTTGVPVRVHMVATQQKIPLFGLLFVLTT